MMEEVLQPSMPFSAPPNFQMAWCIADNALFAMILLIAESRPQEKDLLTRVLVHLIHPENA
jgi:hypothetical protein